MADSTDNASETTYDRSTYVGLLVRTDIPGTLAYLNRCGETERADALRRKLESPPPYNTGDAFLDQVLDAYQDYFRACFRTGLDSPAQTPAVAEPDTRRALAGQLQAVLAMPGADLDALEDALKERLSASGRHYLGGTTGPFLGPYIWQETTQTDYAVELPDRIESLTVFWMDGFIMRSWLAWLSDGETGTGGWAKDEGIYCVRQPYEDKFDTEYFRISFLKHEAQHHVDIQQGITDSGELEYRAKLVELMYYQDASFLGRLLASADLSTETNAHAWAAGKIVAGLVEALEKEGVEDGMKVLEEAVRDEAVWGEYKQGIQQRAMRQMDEYI